MHLPGVIEVEVLAHVCRAAVTLVARVQRVPEGMLIAADPLKRVGRGVVDLLVEQGVVPGGTYGTEHTRIGGEAAGEAGALWYQARPCALGRARTATKQWSE